MANESAQDSSAALGLLSQLEKGATGRLAVGKGASRVAVYVRNGAVLAAESRDDLRQLLRRLTSSRALSHDRIEELEALCDLGESIWGHLFDEVAPELLEVALRDRFRDNLARYLASGDTPRFKPMDTIFVENVQLDDDPARLVAECARLADRARAIALGDQLEPGTALPEDDFGRHIVARVQGGTSLGAVLAALPVEPMAGRAAVARLLERGVVRIRGVDEDVDDPATDIGVVPVRPETPGSTQLDLDDVELDPPTDEQQVSTEGTGDLTSLDAWMDHGVDIEDDLLEAFADHDYDRGAAAQGAGGASDGTFKAESQHLDRVEVDEVDDDPPTSDGPIEAEEPPQARFSAPVLSEEDALTKIEVANACLRAMASALDAVEGSGAGHAAVQLLVDGGPARFSELFFGIQVTEAGDILPDDVLDNLAERPPTEHRALLNQGLVDLIERGLSTIGDELPDEQFDTMYEQVSGFRQRLGL